MRESIDIISAREAAEIIGVTPRRIRQLIQSGIIAARRIGGGYTMQRRDVMAYLKK